MHKPGFKLHARILHHLFGVATSGVIKEPLWDDATTPGGSSAFPSNAAWLQQRLSHLLQHSFPNLRPQQIEVQPLSTLTPKPYILNPSSSLLVVPL